MQDWSLTSWQKFSYSQAANYSDEQQLHRVVDTLSNLPPLVTSNEINRLKNSIALAGQGKAFLLQGGDCAESFNDCSAKVISNKLKILLQMSLVLLYGLRKPIIRVGRIAGQYAKPRSSDFETIGNLTLPSYRGDLINSPAFDAKSRASNPQLLLQGFSSAAISLNYIRALLNSGFADLHYPHRWDLGFVKNLPQAQHYRNIAASISGSLDFLDTIDGVRNSSIDTVDFYTSHEALHLYYEQALTRQLKDGWYNQSTHFPWIGMRTAYLDSAHVEYMRGIKNPIGVKIGPDATKEWLVDLLKILNPNREPGRIVLISRLGASRIDERLPPLIAAVQACKIPVTWSCDPMHGNTETTSSGIKTRQFGTILAELKQALTIHHALNSHLGGVHFELTGDDVTECIGGAGGLDEQDLQRAYKSLVDPRLNYEQSLEMALHFGELYARFNHGDR